MEENVFDQEFFNQTTIHPIGLVIIILLCIISLFIERKKLGLVFIIIACFVPYAQRVVIAGIDFTFYRILIVFAWFRIVIRNEYWNIKETWQKIDTLFIIYLFTSTVPFVLLRGGSVSSIIYRCGIAFDAAGLYFTFRVIIRGWDDLFYYIKAFSYISIPVAVFFMIEKTTGRNMFSIFGGVPEITLLREGQLRCQGAFNHPILAGCFWASLLPIVAARIWDINESRKFNIFIIANFIIIILAASSSTPIGSLFLASGAAYMVRYRDKLNKILKWLVFVLIFIHFARERPVWHLISKIDLAGGSTGWHRYFLIDQWIMHFSDWWLLGIVNTGAWAPQLIDVTNHFIGVAIDGGILSLIVFVMIIKAVFNVIGVMWRKYSDNTKYFAMSWALGLVLLIHISNFIAVAYFGKIILVWYFTLAVIAGLNPEVEAELIEDYLQDNAPRLGQSFS